MNSKKLAHLLAITVMVIWGLSYLSINAVVQEVEPILSAFYRFFIAAIILYVILKVKYPKEKILKEDRLKMALGGLFGVGIYFVFENYAVLYTTTSNVAILLSTIPIFTLISQRILYKEKLTALKVFGTLLSVIGIIVIIASKQKVSLFSRGTLGDLLALGAAVCWVVYNLVAANFKGKYKSITITTYQAIWGCVFLTPSLFLNHLAVPSPKLIFNLIYLSVFCTCLGYVFYIQALKHLGATVLTTYINLQPIVTLLSARLILKENITIWQVLGCFIIIIGVFMVSNASNFNLDKFKEMV